MNKITLDHEKRSQNPGENFNEKWNQIKRAECWER